MVVRLKCNPRIQGTMAEAKLINIPIKQCTKARTEHTALSLGKNNSFKPISYHAYIVCGNVSALTGSVSSIPRKDP